MNDNNPIKLADVINYKKGYAFKSSLYKDVGRTIVRVSNTTKDSIDINSCVKIDEVFAKRLTEYELFTDDIVIMTVGSWPENPASAVGKVIRVPSKANKSLLNQNAVRIRSNGLIDQTYLYYKLKTPEFAGYIENSAQGSANQASITLNDIFSFEFIIPSIEDQKKISRFLNDIDNKIELLNKQNYNLEKIGELLFRELFIEKASNKWPIIKLDTLVECINGVSYKSDHLNPSKTAMVTLKSFDRNGGFRIDGFKEYTGKFKEQQILVEGDLVVAHTDITQDAEVIGNPVLVISDPKYDILIFSMDLVKVVSKDKKIKNDFLYYLMKSKEFKEHCIGYSNGSTVLHLNKKAIPDFEFKMPPIELIKKFSDQLIPLLDKQFNNQKQLKTLIALRDNLLPKLMNGELIINK